MALAGETDVNIITDIDKNLDGVYKILQQEFEIDVD